VPRRPKPGSRSALPAPHASGRLAVPAFSEAIAWNTIGAGWRPLFGSFRRLGFSFEWHDFMAHEELDWSRSFHPGGLELCLNLDGNAQIVSPERTVELLPRTNIFYFHGYPPLRARRRAGDRHRFITVEFAPEFVRMQFDSLAEQMHPLVRAVAVDQAKSSNVSAPERMGTNQLQLIESLRHCPVFQPAQEMWFRCKALELATHLFFQAAGGEEMFCTRAQRLARERVHRAQEVLRTNLVDPPTLDELGKKVGCSPFYLSRLFSQEAGMTIQQFIRQVRMERAAELLRAGKCNVTEAAFAVGYNSLSHFSTTFHETYGCCPGLYPIKTTAQRSVEP
jgi:AraC-like DNA-binding protein